MSEETLLGLWSAPQPAASRTTRATLHPLLHRRASSSRAAGGRLATTRAIALALLLSVAAAAGTAAVSIALGTMRGLGLPGG